MVRVLRDRVEEITLTEGTGNFDLAGATTSHVSFNSAVGTGPSFYYVCEGVSTPAEWEIGEGVLLAPTVLQRTRIIKSSNGNSAVSFSAGTKRIFLDVPAEAFQALQTYTHDQAVPSTTWTITHNLKKFPSVTVIDSAGTVTWGKVDYASEDVLSITFSSAFGGKAYLN